MPRRRCMVLHGVAYTRELRETPTGGAKTDAH